MSQRGIFITLISLFFLSFSSLPLVAQKSDPKSDPKKVQNPIKVNVTGKKQQEDKDKQKSRDAENASKVLKKWIDEDVAYIITGEERAAWKGLKTDEERESFIESFWLRRDPTPDTIDNEYRDNHYQRIAYANEHYGSGTPGWKTDRGRVYIMYGKADEITSHPAGGVYERPPNEGGGSTSTYPFETWRYRYIEGIGNDIELEFVDPSMTGEYRMTMDPNEKDAMLHVPGAGQTNDEMYNGKDKADRVTGNSNGNGGPFGGPGLGKTPFDRLQLFADIYKPPEVKYKDLEAVITTKLSYNVLPFNYRTDFVRVTEDMVLMPVTISIQNKDFAWQEQQGVHTATGHVLIEVTGVNGRRAPNGVIEDNIQQQIADSQFKQRLEGTQIYQKIIPLKPGLYKIDVVVKDMNSGNVGADHRSLRVPRFPDEQLTLSSLIVADLVQSLPPSQVGTGAFALVGDKVRPAVTSEFQRSRDKDVNLWFQVYNLKIDESTKKPSATIETIITRNNQEVKKTTEQSSQLANAAAQMTVVRTFPMTDFEPGVYSIQVKVTDNLTKDVTAGSDKFTIR